MGRVPQQCVPRAPRLDFWDQRDEPHRFCAGVLFHRLLRARLPRQRDLLRRKAPSCQPAQRKKILSLAQEAQFVWETRAGSSPEVSSHQGGQASDGAGRAP